MSLGAVMESRFRGSRTTYRNQDLLLERVIERKEAIERGQDGRAKVLENDQRVQTGKGEHQEMDNGRIGLA
jgi:hypothetical protein